MIQNKHIKHFNDTISAVKCPTLWCTWTWIPLRLLCGHISHARYPFPALLYYNIKWKPTFHPFWGGSSQFVVPDWASATSQMVQSVLYLFMKGVRCKQTRKLRSTHRLFSEWSARLIVLGFAPHWFVNSQASHRKPRGYLPAARTCS